MDLVSRIYIFLLLFNNNSAVKTALQAPLHAMDCTDMIVASVIDGRSRIQDMYTRDRSTPLPDTFFEGENSLTAGFGIERDGRTVVMFRRNVREIEPSDHPLGPGGKFKSFYECSLKFYSYSWNLGQIF